MRKRTIQKLTMLAFIVMASIPAFAQGGKFGSETNAGVATSITPGHVAGDVFDYQELRYYVKSAEDGILELEVIGLSSQIAGATGDPEILTRSDLGTDVTIVPKTVMIPLKMPAESGINGEVVSIAANAFTSTVLYPSANGQTADSKDQFADAAALVTTLKIDYSAEATIVATIGANAFAGLTALTQVENFTPGDKILEIPETSFSVNVFKTAKLKVPTSTDDVTLKAYAKKNGWKKFYLKSDGSKTLGDITGDNKINAFDLNKIKALIASGAYDIKADLTGDGKVNSFDLNQMKKIIAGTY